MTIEFYVNQSEKNRLDKTLISAFNLNGELKEDCSIIDPVIKIAADVSSMSSVNYMYIASFGRYYFINNIISINNDICEVHAHVDVLSTYKDEIRAQRAVVSRQEKKWNLYLNDGVFKTYQNPYIITKAFSSGFTSQHFVLSIAGG